MSERSSVEDWFHNRRIQALGEAQERAKLAAKARSDLVRMKAGDAASTEFGNMGHVLTYRMVVMMPPNLMHRIADQMDRTYEQLSETVRSLIEAGLAAKESEDNSS